MRPKAKHERFAQLLADGLPQHDAYIGAGFKAAEPRSAATKLLQRNSSIRQRVESILAERASAHADGLGRAVEAVGVSKESLLRDLLKIRDMGMAATELLKSDGTPTGAYQQNLTAALRAIEMYGREAFGAFVDKKEIRTGALDNLSHDNRKLLDEALAEARSTVERAAAGSAGGDAAGKQSRPATEPAR